MKVSKIDQQFRPQWNLGRYFALTNFNSCWSVVILIVVLLCLSANLTYAQNSRTQKADQLQPLHSGVSLYEFTGNIRWQTHYSLLIFPHENGRATAELEKTSLTRLKAQFRNLYLLNQHFGLGYTIFMTVYMNGFFKGGGLGGVGGGPVVRYYPLKTTRWQPYLQGSFIAGYNLALSDALGINDVKGFRYRSGLRAGLDYKVSNALGIFLEVGPDWEYDESFLLDSHALQMALGIELFRF